MNWTIYYSVFCLRGLLPNEHKECWRHFVLACRRLCRKELSMDDVTIADALLLNFGKRISHLYGKQAITPNMHLHSHLASCIKDYGPCHTFWLFSFERYNGILGKQPTNNRSIEVQLMARFLKDNMHLDLLNQVESGSVSLAKKISDTYMIVQHAINISSVGSNTSCPKGFSDPTNYTLTVLSSEEITVLTSAFALLYPDICDYLPTTVMPITARKFKYMKLDGVKLSSVEDKTTNPYIFAKPFISFSTHSDIEYHPAEVQYFVRYSFEVMCDYNSTHITHTFAVVNWPQVHPAKDSVGKPVQIWCYELFESTMNCFVPVENIFSRVIIAVDTFEEERVLFVIPVVN